jgi:hypothetical protein
LTTSPRACAAIASLIFVSGAVVMSRSNGNLPAR